jgi:uncharacterized protein YkwD
MRGVTKRLGSLAAGLAVAAALSACTPGVGSGAACAAPDAPVDPVTVAVFNQVNADRAANGVGGLAWNPQLYCLATDWSAQMAASGNFHHRELNGVIRSHDYDGYSTIGENILRGPVSLTGEEMEAAWMASPLHRENCLSSAFTSIGIGLAVTADGNTIYATQNYGG